MAVYAIQAEGTDLYKIGWSKDPLTRLSSLRTGSPVPLNLVATLATDDPAAEKRVHIAVGVHRQSGEWFKLSAAPRTEDLAEWANCEPHAYEPDHGRQGDGGGNGWWKERGLKRKLMKDGVDPGDADLVDRTEITKRTGTHPLLAREWVRADGFPKPRWRLGAYPIWDWDLDIVPWLKATDRWGVLPLERPKNMGQKAIRPGAAHPINPVGRL